ncbi:MAG: CRISPR system precrRNA processing endoribonuclease RAMP protein Cas6 [Gemmatales bacterium]|nr:CRISPR system precrRNA processing endoribonuclease RAMP protein Cas6 [Gemmatales bacterium]
MSLEQKDFAQDKPHPSWHHPLNRFSLGRYRFLLEVTQDFRLTAFATATLRGGLGYILKKSVCTWPPGICSQCLHAKHCAYSYLFETQPMAGATKLRNFEQVPRPYLLTLPHWEKRTSWWLPPESEEDLQETNSPVTFLKKGEFLECELVLVGRAVLFLPYFLFAFQKLGRRGLGHDRGKFRIAEVRAVCLPSDRRANHSSRRYPIIYHWRYGLCGNDLFTTTGSDILNQWQERPRRITIHFETPTRLEHGDQVCKEISFTDLIRGLLRRLSSLSYFHCGYELQLDYPQLVEESRLVQTAAHEWHWQDQVRFSTRQGQRILLGGVLGHATYEAPSSEAMAAFLPLLAVGQYVHVGKGTVMGLGKFSVRNADWYTGPRKRESSERPG